MCKALATLAWLPLAACAQILDLSDVTEAPRDAALPDATTPDASPTTITVSGRLVERQYDPHGAITEVGGHDEGEQLALVYSTSGDETALTAVPLSIDANGGFLVPGVPSATAYFLRRRLGELLIYHEATGAEPQFIRPRLGRADVVRAAQDDTFRVQATGMSPWRAHDQLVLYCATTPGNGRIPEGGPAVGQTQLQGAVFDWVAQPRVDAAKGDYLLLWHSTDVTSTSGVTASAVVDSLEAHVHQEPGQTAVSGTFYSLPRTIQYSPQPELDAFTGLLRAAYADPLLATTNWYVTVVSSPTATDLLFGTPIVLTFQGVGPPPALGTFLIYGGGFDRKLVRSFEIGTSDTPPFREPTDA